jgi:hypothetical protein
LSAVERLYLALLIDRQNQCFVGRVQIEPHDICDLLREFGIARTAVRLSATDRWNFDYKPMGCARFCLVSI